MSPSLLRSALSRRLTPQHKAWISKLRHGEHPWQKLAQPSSVQQNSITSPYDARRQQAQNLQQIRSILAQAHIDFVELPRLSAFSPRLVVNAYHARAAVAVIRARLIPAKPARPSGRDDMWTVRVFNSKGSRVAARAAEKKCNNIAALTCLRHCLAPNGRDLSTTAEAVTVEFWEELGRDVPRADGGVHVPGTLRRRQKQHPRPLDYIEPVVWHHAVRNDRQLKLPASHLRSLDEPIDIVYTWVDGSDPTWRARMHAARDGLDLSTIETSSISEARFTSRDELKYSLRSIEYYASWARHIFIVTDQQVPTWLDTDHPKITIVDHRDIFTNPDVLPVFNSHAIESQLHHIPGLSDHYLYLNDDCFFLRPTDPELFFTGNGLAKHFPAVVPIDIGPWSPQDLPIIAAAKQGRDHLLEKYGRTITHRFKHTPHPQLRSVLETMEEEEPELFARVAASAFRAPDDVSIPASLHHFDAFERGRSIEGQIGYQFLDIGRNDLELQLGRVARRTDLDVFCLNETTMAEESEEAANNTVAQFLEDRFPVPSTFELTHYDGKPCNDE